MFGLKRGVALAEPVAHVDVRFATARDIQQMLEIELLSFDRPWNRLDFMLAMRQEGVAAVTAELGGAVVAYAVITQRARHTEIWNLAAAPHLRRRGLGRTIVERVQASAGRLAPLRAIVSERNLVGQLFFKALGFRATKIIRGYYARCGDDQDAYRFVWKGN